MAEIRNQVLDVNLPASIIDDPQVRYFKTSKKAILDVALYRTDTRLLSVQQRQELQAFVLALENRLKQLPEVFEVNRNSYLQEEIQINLDPEKMIHYDIPISNIASQIEANNIRSPAGSLETELEPQVTVRSELNTVEKLSELIIQGGFDGDVVRLGDVSSIEEGYEKNSSILKVNGHEAIMFSVVKNSTHGISRFFRRN